MFFDQENSRAFRLLCDASNFLEASLDKLLVLEQEALAERDRQIKNATAVYVSDMSEKNITSSKITEKQTVDLNSITTKDSVENENLCKCNSESCDKKCLFPSETKKLDSQSPPQKLENVAKRKYGMIVLNDDELGNTTPEKKKRKTLSIERDINHINPEIHMNSEDEASVTSSSTLTDLTSNNGAAHQDQNYPDPQTTEITFLEEFFKVYIIFKDSLQYKTVEKLIKSVGLEDVFDIVLTKKKAEVTFLNENSMKKALNLPFAALNKLKAAAILPVE